MNPEPIDICVITTVSITLRAFLLDQLVYLTKNGFKVTIVCNYDPEFKKNCPKELEYVPINMIRGIGFFSTLIGLWQFYKLFNKRNFTIVQYSTPKAALISSIAGFLARVPIRLYCQWGIRYVGFTGLIRKIFKILERTTCYLSTDIAPDSQGNLDFSVNEGLYPFQKAAVVHKGSANGVNLRKFDISYRKLWCDNIRSNLKIAADSFVFGYIGRITRDKGIGELISAFMSLESEKKSILLLVGEKEERHGLEADIIKAIDTYPGIYTVGPRNNPQEYISAMDVMVLPSYREGFGVVAIEAQAMGVPVITTDIPGPREAVVNGETGLLVPAAEVLPLQLAMQNLRDNPELLNSMAKNGHKFVTDNFEQYRFWEKVLEHRRCLLGKLKL